MKTGPKPRAPGSSEFDADVLRRFYDYEAADRERRAGTVRAWIEGMRAAIGHAGLLIVPEIEP